MVNTQSVKNILKGSEDISFIDLYINKKIEKPVTLVYVQGLVNTAIINESLLKPLTQDSLLGTLDEKAIIDQIIHGALYHLSKEIKDSVEEVVTDVLTGNAVLIFDGEKKAIVFEVRGFDKRGISEPSDENVIKGSKDSFIEVMRVNTALIRRRIVSSDLRIKEVVVGKNTKTTISIVYLNGVAKPTVISEVEKRINEIDIDSLKSAGSMEEHIVDHKYSIFPQTIYTERPDKACSNILEGKIAIIIDGYPIVYIVPVVFNMLFQSGEDYSFNYIQSSVVRLLRYICAFISLILPGFYISIVSFHQEMLPTSLMISIIKSKESVPVSSFFEVILLLLAFEILIEAGVRLPKTIGQAISIVGGLVIGDAAVNAKFVSPAVVVVLAVAAICGFIIPNQDLSNSFRILRGILVLASSFLGLYGLAIAFILILYYLCTLTSFNMPFMRESYPNRKYMIFIDGLFRIPRKEKREGN